MGLARWAAFARKAARRPPGFLIRRGVDELRRQAFRPWGRLRPLLLTEKALLRATNSASIDALWQRLARAAFPVETHASQEWACRFNSARPETARAIVSDADRLLRHEFDLLGSGIVPLGTALPWHDDFKVGRRWPLQYGPDIDYNELDKPSDVKVPWELSRCQHFSRLGQAYWLTREERYAREFVEEVSDWLAANPWTRGVNWTCTMDVALRAVSWIWAFRYFADAPSCRSHEFRSAFLRSLFLHGEYVASNVEMSDINGNHYTVDGVGLVFLGLIFRGAAAAAKWLEAGKDIVYGEILSQVWPDGVDFEQSVAYHRLVLESFLTSYVCLRTAGEGVPRAAWERLERMLEFVSAYTKPNGQAPLIGDADDGRVQKFGLQDVNDHRYLLSTGAVLFRRPDFKTAAGFFSDESFWLLGPEGADAFETLPVAPPIQSKAFPDGGFYVMRHADTHVIVDCAEVGMRGRGGHGHNDILSFELFLKGANIVTDCGAYLYTASREWRNRFRSTAFHNTLQVDGEELNRFISADEMWRLRDDARPMDVVWWSDENADVLRAAHGGYTRLDSPVTHAREWLFDKIRQRVVVRDIVRGRDVHHLVWRFHLDPAVEASADASTIRMKNGDCCCWLQLVDAPAGLKPRLESGWVSPSYGRKFEAPVIVLEREAALPVEIAFCFSPTLLSPAELDEAVGRLHTLA
jgi:uncharacterized heparinase superfamily protein